MSLIPVVLLRRCVSNTSVYTRNTILNKNSDSPGLATIDFGRQDLVTSIVQVSNNSAAGPDNFPAIHL